MKVFVFMKTCIFLGFLSLSASTDGESSTNSNLLDYDQVCSQVISSGGAATHPHPPGFTPRFVSDKLTVFVMPDNEITAVYGWYDSNGNGYTNAATVCDQKYYSNGDCKDTGSECDVTLENGKAVISKCNPV